MLSRVNPPTSAALDRSLSNDKIEMAPAISVVDAIASDRASRCLAIGAIEQRRRVGCFTELVSNGFAPRPARDRVREPRRSCTEQKPGGALDQAEHVGILPESAGHVVPTRLENDPNETRAFEQDG